MDWSGKRCVVLDMDGTVYLGHLPIAGAVAFIRRHWQDLDFYFLSNNTSKSPHSYVARLNLMGIPATLSRLLSPVRPLVDFLRARKIGCLYPVGNTEFQGYLHECMPELEFAEAGAQAVVLAYDTELSYHRIARAALLLQKPQVLFLATHPDLVCPSPEGPLPDVGSFIALFASATGRQPQFIFGKPDPQVLAPLLVRYRKAEMLMVGDRLATDMQLARNAGIDSILVLSGEATLEDVAKEKYQPTLVLNDLGEAEKDWPGSASEAGQQDV